MEREEEQAAMRMSDEERFEYPAQDDQYPPFYPPVEFNQNHPIFQDYPNTQQFDQFGNLIGSGYDEEATGLAPWNTAQGFEEISIEEREIYYQPFFGSNDLTHLGGYPELILDTTPFSP